MNLRFTPVDGDLLPTGVCVAVVEGEDETVVQLARDYTLEDLCAALSPTLTTWANERMLYVGQIEEANA